ncbi:MAG: hypothetical protein IPH68_07335 [Chitinophagaceae bacterium]|nr:hypothetical protein [Chitinophagaceae bacterium]
MKIFKKIVKIFLIVIVILAGLVFAAPYIFKGKIVSLVKREVNNNLTAKVDFKDVDISFFRHFPKVSIALDSLQVTGTGDFLADTLLSAKRMDATVNFMSFIRGKDMSVYTVLLESPRINAIVNKDGLANWDIVKMNDANNSADTAADLFKLQLNYYSIENGYLNYMDVQNNMSVVTENLNHSGSGDFTADLFTLSTRSTADAVSFNYGAIPYLSKVRSNINADIKIDNKNGIYSFDAIDILLNELKIIGKGNIKSLANGGYDLDISFNAPSSEFKNILSLVTPIYKKEFEKVTASGTAIFEGFVKGVYKDSVMPAYHIDAAVKDASFKYTDLPKGITAINFKALVDNPDGKPDNMVVDISKGHLVMDNEPFDFRLLVKNPESNMYVDGAAKGKLDLSQVADYVKLEKGTAISGLMNADVNIKGNVKELEKQQYNNFYAAGTVDVNNFNYRSSDYPTGIKINKVNTVFTPTRIDVSNLDGQYMNSNFNGGGQINNLLSYLLNGKPLSADLTVNADKVNLNDWMGVSADTASKGPATVPFAVPGNLDISLNTKIDELKYDNIEIKNVTGNMQLADETVKLNNVNGFALDGIIKINGSYSTKASKTKPAIAMSYDVAQVDIQKTFYAFNTVQKLMPVGKFLAGKLTSVLSANGKLGDNMSIDMSTLSGNGNLFLIEGFLSKFAPLDKIASMLQVKELEQLSLKGVKTFFEFSNGKLLVKPFTVKVKDIEMEIGGLQGFDETINYAINLKLPRALMGTQGNQLVNNLAGAMQAKGIPFKLSETVNLKLAMGGTIKAPTLKVDFKQSGETLAEQMKEQVKDFAQAKIDSAKNAARDSLNSIKKQLGDAAKEELRKKISGIKDTTAVKDSTAPVKTQGDKTKESVKGLLDNLLKKKQKDTANKQ